MLRIMISSQKRTPTYRSVYAHVKVKQIVWLEKRPAAEIFVSWARTNVQRIALSLSDFANYGRIPW
jgi:hypothetical protein